MILINIVAWSWEDTSSVACSGIIICYKIQSNVISYSGTGGYHSNDEKRMYHYLGVYSVVKYSGFIPKVALKNQKPQNPTQQIWARYNKSDYKPVPRRKLLGYHKNVNFESSAFFLV